MKKLIILLLSILMLLCSCTNSKDIEIQGGTVEATDEDADRAYESIERYKSSGYSTGYYGFKNDSVVLNITYPKEWTFKQSEGGFDIMRGKNVIGRIIGEKESDLDDWKVLENEEHSENGVDIAKFIERCSSDGETEYRYRYVYYYNSDNVSRAVTLTADCAEISKMSETKLLTNIYHTNKSKSNTIGVLSDVKDPTSILILGNSFIGSSDIGYILNEMLYLNDKNCTVDAISRGYATVATYAGDPTILNYIRNGSYDAVFICGFYSQDQSANLGILKNACDSSNTKLVIFPAHNENSNSLSIAQTKYPSLVCLNWRAEINSLIAGGVDRWDLCYDDDHDHSSPLAGYVGAHMIYRAIYGELPKVGMKSSMWQSDIDSILGDYAYTGDLQLIDDGEISYFDQ